MDAVLIELIDPQNYWFFSSTYSCDILLAYRIFVAESCQCFMHVLNTRFIVIYPSGAPERTAHILIENTYLIQSN